MASHNCGNRGRLQLRRRKLELRDCVMVTDQEIIEAVRDLAAAWRDVYDGASTFLAVVDRRDCLDTLVNRIATELRGTT